MLVPIAAEELERRATIRPPSALLVPLIWCPFRACFSGGWIPGLKPHKTLACFLGTPPFAKSSSSFVVVLVVVLSWLSK
jgi:hypothetical protein